MRATSLTLLAVSALLLSACGSGEEPVTNPESLRLRQPEPAEETPSPGETPSPAPETPPAAGTERAPDEFTVRLDTTAGEILIDVHRDWSPLGVDRFYELVTSGYYTDIAFFRVLPGFVAQAGIHGDPNVSRQWRDRGIPDEPVRQGNTRGRLTYAKGGPNSRTTQFFINFSDNSSLDRQGFPAFGEVRDMTAVDRINSEYRERPNQGQIQSVGNDYLRREFPNLDYIRSAEVVETEAE